MRLTRVALVLMLGAFVLGVIVAMGSLISTGGHLDTEALKTTPLSAPVLLVTFLTPWAIVLEIIAIVLIVLDSRRVGGLHRRLVLVALWLFVAWGVANVGGFLPLTLMGVRRQSLGLLRAGQAVKALGGLLHYGVPFLLVFAFAGRRVRAVLGWALVLTVVGNSTTVILGASAMQLSVPVLSVDYSRGVYPVSLGLGYAGALLHIVAYATLVVQMRWSTGLLRSAAGAGTRAG